jgi:predicted XRE-type DNA-binding protein
MARPRARKARPGRAANKSPTSAAGHTIAKKPLAHEVVRVLAEKELSQVAAGLIVGEQQSQISLVCAGRLDGFSPERLIRMLTRLGREVDISIRPTRTGRAGKVRVAVGRARR